MSNPSNRIREESVEHRLRVGNRNRQTTRGDAQRVTCLGGEVHRASLMTSSTRASQRRHPQRRPIPLGKDHAVSGDAPVASLGVIELVERRTVLAVVVGSRAYGLHGPDSDYDRRGVFAVPTRAFWHLDKPPTHVDGPAAEQFSWEFERFCLLALQGNPTVLEVLWSPLVETITPDGERLLAARQAFLSRRVAETYGTMRTTTSGSRRPSRICTPRPGSSNPRCTRCAFCLPGST